MSYDGFGFANKTEINCTVGLMPWLLTQLFFCLCSSQGFQQFHPDKYQCHHLHDLNMQSPLYYIISIFEYKSLNNKILRHTSGREIEKDVSQILKRIRHAISPKLHTTRFSG